MIRYAFDGYAVCALHRFPPRCVARNQGRAMHTNRSQVRGRIKEAKGKIKEKAGQVTKNPNLEAEGQAEKVGGKVQKKVGQVEKVLEK